MRHPTHTAFCYKNGPTCVGKGFLEKLEKRALAGLIAKNGLKIASISFGQIIRTKLESEERFRKLHGSTIQRGDLLGDEVAIEIFSEQCELVFDQGEPDIVLVDGFGRSAPQIKFAADNGYLRERDHFYFIEASLQDCLERFLHRKGKGDTARIDHEVETFHHRYHLHRQTVGNLRATLLESGSQPKIIDIDANRRSDDGDDALKCIPEAVCPAVLFELLPLAFQQLSARKPVMV